MRDQDFDLTHTDWLDSVMLSTEQREAWNRMRSELIASRAKIIEQEKRIRILENQVDHPQGEEQISVLTRPEFNREVARMLAFNERYGGFASVVYFNFENLSDMTAQYGRSVVNSALREISTLLMHNVRRSDIVGRLAPDEFGVLLGRCDNLNAWKKGTQLHKELLAKMQDIHGCKLNVNITFGAYTFQDKDDVGNGLRQAAQMVTTNRA